MANKEPDRSLLGPAVLVGIGVAGSLDEIVLHQLLRWHHFYDRGSQAAGLIADGISHLGSTAALVIGLMLSSDHPARLGVKVERPQAARRSIGPALWAVFGVGSRAWKQRRHDPAVVEPVPRPQYGR